ncbi:hypothetical protein ALC57_18409 [Trachymyrmex cornetzi]|uniref:Uncharacterized protein n=1 Tax=Trachymyrmex cornetzi TaxID=471704 RepID=A0A151IRW5_9HYME|nr:hypothetical protein ALC57_18409 [Trachymyrmex cornetzi]
MCGICVIRKRGGVRGVGIVGKGCSVREVGYGGGSDFSYGGGIGEGSSDRGGQLGGSGVGDGSCVGEGCSSYWGQLGDGSGDLGDWSSVGEGCSVCDMCDGGGNWGDGLDGNGGGFLADYGVESVDRVSGVVNSAPGAISFQEGVATLDEVAVTGLVLALGISGQAVMYVIGVAVLWMRVEVGVDSLSHHCLGNGSGSDDCGSRGISQGGGGRKNTGVGDGHKGSKNDELQKNIGKISVPSVLR